MKAKSCFFSLLSFIFFLNLVLVSAAAAVTTIMPLGDSITEGYIDGSTPAGERVGYRKKLYADLIGQGYDINIVGSLPLIPPTDPDFDYDHEGHGGLEADEISDSVFDWLQLNPADIVLLHIGTNDIANGGETPADVVSQVDLVLYEIFQYDPEIIVILARIIDRQTHDPDITSFNNLLLGMVIAHPNRGNIFLVDHENALDYATDMANDLHPNMSGYYKMADVWLSALEQVLPDPNPPNNPSSSDSGGGCFIAAAAYGSYREERARVPQESHDPFQLTSMPRKAFMDLYHTILRLLPISSLPVFIK